MEINDPQENYKTGFIAIYRSIKNHWIFESDKYFKWWIIMLMEANHQPNKMALGYKLYEIEKGQSSNSLRTWANLFNTGTKQVTKFFELLELDKMISKKTIGKGKQSTTLITIENYSNYQYGRETLKTTLKTTQGKRKRHTNNNANNVNNETIEEEPKKETPPTDLEIKTKFLKWFNIKRSKFLNKPSNIKSLTKTDLDNLKKLRKDYEPIDFAVAFDSMVKNEWVIEKNFINPAHFLINKNFNRYHSQAENTNFISSGKEVNADTADYLEMRANQKRMLEMARRGEI